MFSNILVAVKEGIRPQHLVELSTSVAQPGARLHLATFVRAGNQHDELSRIQAESNVLKAQAASLSRQGYIATFEAGPVAAGASFEVLHRAEERGCDLIVIGMAKRSRVGKALMGSDAQRILIGARAPVLAIRIDTFGAPAEDGPL